MEYDSPGKRFVRGEIDPLYIDSVNRANNNGGMYYLGLPGEDIQDLIAWRDYLTGIIAIEYSDKKSVAERKKIFKAMESNIELEFGTDPSSIPRKFLHNEFEYLVEGEPCTISGERLEIPADVNLLNLDFCRNLFAFTSAPASESPNGDFGRTGQCIINLIGKIKAALRSSPGPSSSYIIILITFNKRIRKQRVKKALRTILEDAEIDVGDRSIENIDNWHMVVWQFIGRNLNKEHSCCIQAPSMQYIGRTTASPMAHCVLIMRFDARRLSQDRVRVPINLPTLISQTCHRIEPDRNNCNEVLDYHRSGIQDLMDRLSSR